MGSPCSIFKLGKGSEIIETVHHFRCIEWVYCCGTWCIRCTRPGRKIPDKYLETWQTAVQYQMFHAVGLLVLGLLAGKIDSPLINWSGWLMLIGIILFSGSLFVLSVTQIKVLGAITPLGGVSFLVAWVLMIIAAYKYL